MRPHLAPRGLVTPKTVDNCDPEREPLIQLVSEVFQQLCGRDVRGEVDEMTRSLQRYILKAEPGDLPTIARLLGELRENIERIKSGRVD